MDINRFTAELTLRLIRAGADEAAARRHVRSFVASLPENEAAAFAAHSDDEDVMRQLTDRIMARIGKEPPAPAQVTRPPEPENIAPPNANPNAAAREDDGFDDLDDADDDMFDAMLSQQIPKVTPPVQERVQPQTNQPQGNRQPGVQQGGQPQRNEPQPQKALPQGAVRRPAQNGAQQRRPAPASVRQQPEQQGNRPTPRQREDARPVPRRKRPIYKPDPNADYKKFYIIFGCTSPIWGFILLAAAAAFAVAIGALAVSIVLLIAALFVGVAVGVVLTFVGIIYGITQLFELRPVGLYEIGLGIMIGGNVMFAGVAAYNIAVHFLPFLIKEVLVLLSFTIHKCIELYYYVKGRCADL